MPSKYTRSLILLTKGLLTSNVYMGVFFPILRANQLDDTEILAAVAIGIKAMILGDFLSSLLVDLFGVKRPVIAGALVQALAIGMAPFCHNFGALVGVEILIGLSFPVILGADSKWLRKLDGAAVVSEQLNQATLFLSQTLSALASLLLIKHAYTAFTISCGLYLTVALVASLLPDVQSQNTTVGKKFAADCLEALRSVATPSILLGAAAVGFMGGAPWVLQLIAGKVWSANQDLAAAMAQAGVCGFSLVGTFLASRLRVNWHWIGCGLIAAALLAVYQSSIPVLTLALSAGVIARGAVAVVAREKLFAKRDAAQPIATLNFAFSSVSRMMQAASLALIVARFG